LLCLLIIDFSPRYCFLSALDCGIFSIGIVQAHHCLLEIYIGVMTVIRSELLFPQAFLAQPGRQELLGPPASDGFSPWPRTCRLVKLKPPARSRRRMPLSFISAYLNTSKILKHRRATAIAFGIFLRPLLMDRLLPLRALPITYGSF
jgi:hypothetical protein